MTQTFPNLARAFPDFDQATLPVIPVGFDDSPCHHNDMCPSFIHEATGLLLYIDYANPDDRDLPETGRFMLSQMQMHAEYGWQAGDSDAIIVTDDWLAMFGAIRQAMAATPNFDGKGILYEVEVPAQLLVAPTTLEEAKVWISGMIAADLDIHLDDSADSIICPHGPLFRAEDCDTIDACRMATFIFDWGVYEDPHGYNIAACKEAGKQDFWTQGDHIEFGGGIHAEVVEVDPTNRYRAILKVEDGSYMPVETTMEDSAWGNFIDLREDATFATVEEARAALAPPTTMTLDAEDVAIIKTVLDTFIGDDEEIATAAGAAGVTVEKVNNLLARLDAWPHPAPQAELGL